MTAPPVGPAPQHRGLPIAFAGPDAKSTFLPTPPGAALYSAGTLAGSAIDSCGCAAAVCGSAGAGAGPAAPDCAGRTPGSLRKASHCSFVP